MLEEMLRGGSRGIVGFDPTTIPGCTVWFDAADTGTMSLSVSSVQTWRSKGSAACTAVSTFNAPVVSTIGGLSALYFNGVSTMMKTNMIASYGATETTWITCAASLATVSGSTPADACPVIATSGSGAERAIRYTCNVNATAYSINTTVLRQTTGDNTNGVRGFIDTAAYFAGFTNGSLITSNTTAVTFQAGVNQSFVMGQWNVGWLNGYVYEILIYNRALSLGEYQSVEGYLSQKWGFSPAKVFKPTSIPGCQMWLDGADTSIIGFSSGSNVNLWKDKSGNNLHASNTSIYPTYSGSNLVFNGSQQLLLPPFIPSGTKNITIAAIWTCTSASTGGSFQSIIEQNAATGGAYWRYMIQGYGFLGRNAYMYGLNEFGANPTPGTSFPTFVVGTPNLSVITQSSTDGINFTINNYSSGSLYGSQTYGTAVGAATQGTIGSNTNGESFIGNISEIIIFTSASSALATAQRQAVEGYLAWKWNLQGSLVSTHPNYLTTANFVKSLTLATTHPYYSVPPATRAFTPLDLPACSLWLDAADTATLITTGSTVTRWNDKSGNANKAVSYNGTVSTGSNINGLNALYFPAQAQLVLQTSASSSTFTTGTNITCFIVAQGTQTLVSGSGYFFITTDNFSANAVGPNWSYYYVTGVSANPFFAYKMNLTEYDCLNVIRSPTSAGVFCIQPQLNLGTADGSTYAGNGAASLPAGSYNTCLGGVRGDSYAFKLGEVIIFNSSLSSAQRQQVEGYLAAKWGLNANMPAFVNPTSIPGCQLWMDAADSSTVLGSASAVTQWNDKSGKSRNLTAVGTVAYSSSNIYTRSTSGSTPSHLYVNNAVDLTSFTVFYVGRTATGNDNSVVIAARPTGSTTYDWNSSDGFGLYLTPTSGVIYAGSPTTSVSNSVTATVNNLYSYTDTSAGAISSWTNGTAGATATAGARSSTAQGFAIAGAWGGTSWVPSYNGVGNTAYTAEAIVYNTVLTTAQRQTVEGYLAWKWGLQASLPSTHPFYAAVPIPHPFNKVPPVVRQPALYYDVTPGNWARDWQPYLKGLAAANSTGVTITTTNLTGGATYTADDRRGCVLGLDGNIYVGPYAAANILKLNVTTGITTNITGGATYTASGWQGGVLGPDGNIYFSPSAATNILKLNVSTGVTTNITGGATYSGGWVGGVLGPDGNIYFIPFGATNFLKLNVSTGVTTNITGGATFAASGWNSGVLGSDGNIYLTPFQASNILKLNVATGVSTNITGGATYTTNGWTGGVLGPDGNIYFTPFAAANILKLNVSTGVTTNITGGATYTANGWLGGVLGPDGNIYFVPYAANNILKLNVSTGITTNITGGATFTTGGWLGGILAQDGNIYMAPVLATNILKVNFSGLSQKPSSNYCLSAWANKF